MRLGMKCYSRFLNGDVDVDFVVEQREKNLSKISPTQTQVKKWFNETCLKIKSLSGSEVDDPHLVECLDLVSPEFNEG